MDLEDAIKAMIARGIIKHVVDGDINDDSFKSVKAAQEALKKFIDEPAPDIKVGDFVVRNDYGMKMYAGPKENQAAICTKILENPIMDESQNMCDMQICVAFSEKIFRFFLVNSKFYKKAEARARNVFDFRKKT